MASRRGRRGGGEDPWLCGPGFGRVCSWTGGSNHRQPSVRSRSQTASAEARCAGLASTFRRHAWPNKGANATRRGGFATVRRPRCPAPSSRPQVKLGNTPPEPNRHWSGAQIQSPSGARIIGATGIVGCLRWSWQQPPPRCSCSGYGHNDAFVASTRKTFSSRSTVDQVAGSRRCCSHTRSPYPAVFGHPGTSQRRVSACTSVIVGV